MKKRVPNRETILKKIENNLNNAYVWGNQFEEKCINTEYVESAFVCIHKAEALIELLEIHDCGSIGGFDQGRKGLYSLEERYELLKSKYVSKRSKRSKK